MSIYDTISGLEAELEALVHGKGAKSSRAISCDKLADKYRAKLARLDQLQHFGLYEYSAAWRIIHNKVSAAKVAILSA